MCSGSVHTFHTRSRGASKTRTAAISRSPTSAAKSFLSPMFHVLGQVIGQALEGLAPALVLAAAGLARRRGLSHGQLSLAEFVGERQSRQQLVAGSLSRIAVKTMRSFRTISRYTQWNGL